MTVDSWGPHRGESWTSGPWRAEVRSDELADLRHGETLVARSVRAVVRDRDWNTVPVTVVSSRAAGGSLELTLRYDGFGITADAVLRAVVDDDRVTVSLRLVADGAYATARTGLVLLHPPTVAGAPLRVRHTDGTTDATAFPVAISPHQPAFDVAALEWATGDTAVTAEFAGEVFEMEDQRNWTDASYKTYSRPLALPFPYDVADGEVVEQSIAFVVTRVPSGSEVAPIPGSAVRLVPADRAVPSIGVGAATAPLTGVRHAAPPAAFVVVELDARDPDSAGVLARAATSRLPLDVRLTVDDPSQVGPLVAAAAAHSPVRIGVFSATSHVSEPDLWHALVAAAADHAPSAALVGGARSHFTELNRTHERLPRFPSATISITPQMHARETYQLEESIGVQRLVAGDALRIVHGVPLHVGPITLRPRFNAVATTAAGAGAADATAGYGAARLATADDPRQRAAELAAWVVASAAALAEAGAASVTWFEEWGPRGLESDDGTAFPVRAAVAAVHALSGLPLLVPDVPSPADARTWVLAARTPGGTRLLAARLGDAPDHVRVDIDAHSITIELDPGTWKVVDVDDPRAGTTEED